MENNNMTNLESLQLIDSMINKARNRFSENGHLYLVWGWSVLLCAIASFAIGFWHLYERADIAWIGLLLPWLYMMIYLARKKKQQHVKTYTDDIMGMVWLVFSVLMFLLGFILGSRQLMVALYPCFLALYGMPTFLSGVILRFKPLMAGAIVCWLLAILALAVFWVYQPLLLAIAVIAAWIIPGYLLKRKYNKEK